jgi:phosphotransferase system enzyme I (PtsP)
MFPLVSSLEEIRRIKEILAETGEEVRKSGYAVADDIGIGAMIEVPAAVQIADFLIREVDFFSIGTNDLIQYTLAADRNNAKVQHYYDPYHPAVLHSIKRVADSAAQAGKSLSLCGEMASDPLNAILLLGLGITEFSLSAPSLPAVKQALRAISRKEAEEFAGGLLKLGSAVEIQEQVRLFRNKHDFSAALIPQEKEIGIP